jgi:hypothetical protein
MANRRPGDASELDGLEALNSVSSVAEDFAALVAVFDRQLERVPSSDNEMRTHILNAKAAAERGMQLSRLLLKRVQSGSANRT